MANSSRIEWTDATWNPVVGCTKVSAGCKHCYAERMGARLAAVSRAAADQGRNPGRSANYGAVMNGKGRWNGGIALAEDALDDPFRWRHPRLVFVNSMSDLFHEKVPLDFIQRVFDVMNCCPQHTFQVLTKRPERAAEIANRVQWTENIWMGASVENVLVRERINFLRRVPAAVRFISAEPLIGPLPRLGLQKIHWVIVGGESGPGARPMKAEWVRQIRDRCVAQGVAFFFKQWGGVNKKAAGREIDGRCWDEMPRTFGVRKVGT